MDFLFKDDPARLVTYLVSAALLAYLAAIAWWWRDRNTRRRAAGWHRISFIRNLLNAVGHGAVSNLEQGIDLFQAHFGVDSVDVRDRHRFSQLVREAIHKLSTDFERPKKLDEYLGVLRSMLKENETILSSEDLKLPFTGTPDPERRLLEDILELTHTDRSIVQSKLSQLADTIVARHDTITRLSEEGRQSLRYAKLGLVGTVFFSLVSIALTIWAL